MSTATPTARAAPHSLHILWVCLLVGAVYAAANAIVAGALGTMSRVVPGPEQLVVWELSGALTCLALSPFVIHATTARPETVRAAWIVLALVRTIGLGIEGALFKPASVAVTIAGVASGLAVSLLVAWLVVRLLTPEAPRVRDLRLARAPREETPPGWNARGRFARAWRVAAVAVTYVVVYFVFGAINALAVTLPYYHDPQYALAVPPIGTILLAQAIRGPLFALGALAMVRVVRAPRRRLAAWLGALLWVVGGAAPYLETTFRAMPLAFNIATLAELFLQNVLTGAVATYLYASPARHAPTRPGRPPSRE